MVVSNSPLAEDEEAKNDFIDSVCAQVGGVYARYRAGQLVLTSEHISALEEAQHLIGGNRYPGDLLRHSALGEIDELLKVPAPAEVTSVGTELSWVAPPPLVAPAHPYQPAFGFAAPSPGPGAGRPRPFMAPAAIVVAVVLLVAAGGFGYLSVYNSSAASKWKKLDRAQAVVTKEVTSQLEIANGSITELNGDVAGLNSQVSTMQGQLSSVANQKEKAIDQETVFKELLSAAGGVAEDLQLCITSSDQLETDVNNALANEDVSALSGLAPEAAQVTQTCGEAEQANEALQSLIQGAS